VCAAIVASSLGVAVQPVAAFAPRQAGTAQGAAATQAAAPAKAEPAQPARPASAASAAKPEPAPGASPAIVAAPAKSAASPAAPAKPAGATQLATAVSRIEQRLAEAAAGTMVTVRPAGRPAATSASGLRDTKSTRIALTWRIVLHWPDEIAR
jgi:hypothetical protein